MANMRIEVVSQNRHRVACLCIDDALPTTDDLKTIIQKCILYIIYSTYDNHRNCFWLFIVFTIHYSLMEKSKCIIMIIN